MVAAAHPADDGFAPDFVTGVLADALQEGTRILGISGLQGSGKSTLAAQLVEAAVARGLRSVAISIDDFYLDRPERERLARDVHPLLATRGPPGTHDVALAGATLDALALGQVVRLPRFSKLADRRLPQSQWPLCGDVDLVVFDGWFLGTPAQHDEALAEPVNALERDEDPDRIWRRWCNDALARDYPSLWQGIDRLLFLQPPGFDIVAEWRWQQEQSLRARECSRRGMTHAQVERFVQHYERVSRQALRTLPAIADAVVALDEWRLPVTRLAGGAAGFAST